MKTLPSILTFATLLLLTCIASGADVKITDFPASTGGLTAADIVGVVELSGTPTTKKATLTQLKAAMSLNNVQNTALSTWAGSTSLTTLGTISAGTWNGSAITSTYILDGTLVNADIASDAAIAVSKIAGLGTAAIKDTGSTPGTVPLFGTSTYFGAMLSMHSDGAGTVNVYPSEALASDVSLEWPSTSGVLQTTSDQISPARLSGAVSIAFGGTGRTSHTAYGVICGGTTSTNPQQSVVSVGTSGQVLTSNGAGALPTFQTISSGSGTVTSVGFTGGLISVATATSTPVLTVAGTSGGIPYFSSASTWASSAALAANALVIGGGAGAAPATTTTGTGVLTALGIAVGSSGAFVTNNVANTFSGQNTFAQGTITSSKPFLVSQTWNDGAGGTVVYSGMKLAITDASSNLSEEYFGVYAGASGTTKLFSVEKVGGGNLVKIGALVSTNNTYSLDWDVAGVALGSARQFSWSSTVNSYDTADLILRRDAAATLQLGTDAATATTQTIKGADGSGTDKAGFSFVTAGGQSTGTGPGGDVITKTSLTSTTGSSANSYSTRSYTRAKPVDLTESTATLFANVALASSKYAGVKIVATVNAGDGTDFQSLTSDIKVDAVNKAGTVTATLVQNDGTTAASSGTLTATYTAVANGAGFDIKCNAVSSLTQTTLRVKYMIMAINSDDVSTVTP